MMARLPQERCEERLARRERHRVHIEAKLNMTAEQRSFWEKLESANFVILGILAVGILLLVLAMVLDFRQ